MGAGGEGDDYEHEHEHEPRISPNPVPLAGPVYPTATKLRSRRDGKAPI
jgi:hypothetical protein